MTIREETLAALAEKEDVPWRFSERYRFPHGIGAVGDILDSLNCACAEQVPERTADLILRAVNAVPATVALAAAAREMLAMMDDPACYGGAARWQDEHDRFRAAFKRWDEGQ